MGAEQSRGAVPNRLGANSHFGKPVEFQQLTDAVTELGLSWLLVNKPPC